jgi:hypothetical protein
VVFCLAAFLGTQYYRVVTLPLVNDDYFFLDKVRSLGFLELWRPLDLVFGWYRPWSAEFHYWVLYRFFGSAEAPFHLASFVLWTGVLCLYYDLVRRIAGRPAAALGVAAVAALALWSAPLIWAAGAQELWMLLFVLLALHAHMGGRRMFSALGFLLALLSKETAAVTPLILAGYGAIVGRKPLKVAIGQCIHLAPILGAWLLLHPSLRDRLTRSGQESAETLHRPGPVSTAAKTFLAQFNLDQLPRPAGEAWGYVLAFGFLGSLILLLLFVGAGGVAVSGSRVTASEQTPVAQPRAVGFGVAWAMAGWLPLFLPSIGWHAYYGSLGTLGAWLALAALLANRRRLAFVTVAVLPWLLVARVVTPSQDWGTGWYQYRAGHLLRPMRAVLLQMHPAFPPHSRVFFARVPNNVGFIAGNAPSLRVWYRDSTIRGGFYSSYRPRQGSQAPGRDFFFRFDSSRTWVETIEGPEDLVEAMAANLEWERDHRILATTLARGGEYRRAGAEFVKLAAGVPAKGDYPYYAAVCWETLRDTVRATDLYAKAAAAYGMDPRQVRERGRAFVAGLAPWGGPDREGTP